MQTTQVSSVLRWARVVGSWGRLIEGSEDECLAAADAGCRYPQDPSCSHSGMPVACLVRLPGLYRCLLPHLIGSWRAAFPSAHSGASLPPHVLRRFDGLSSRRRGNGKEREAEGDGTGDGSGGATWRGAGWEGNETPFLIVQLSADVNLQGLLGGLRTAQLAALGLPRVAVVPGEGWVVCGRVAMSSCSCHR